MRKSVFLVFGFFVLCSSVFAQQDFGNYTQQVDGTKYSFGMAAVPGGEFTMGNNAGNEDEQPEHKVQISSFWMGTHEVFWELYDLFVFRDLEATHNKEVAIPAGVDAVARPTKPYVDMSFGMGKGKHPAIAMTQYNAIQFCKWLYARTGVFYRLPTEAEWEYAAKTGMTGDDLDDYAWTSDNSDGASQESGTKNANKYGIFDLIGNVSEWTYDQYDAEYYKTLAGKTSIEPVNPPLKLYPNSVRGGSYASDIEYLTPTARDYSDPTWKQLDPQIPKSSWWLTSAPFVGIRLVRPLETPSKEEIMKYYDKEPIKDY